MVDTILHTSHNSKRDALPTWQTKTNMNKASQYELNKRSPKQKQSSTFFGYGNQEKKNTDDILSTKPKPVMFVHHNWKRPPIPPIPPFQPGGNPKIPSQSD